MSNFKIFLLYYIMLIFIIHLSYQFANFGENYLNNYIIANIANCLFIVFSGVFIFVTFMFIGDLGELYPIKYRIKQYNNSIEVSVLQFSYHIIPKWKPLESKTMKCGIGLEGMGRDYYIDYNIKYNSYQEALDAIKRHKDNLVKKRNELYKKNTIQQNKPKVTYL